MNKLASIFYLMGQGIPTSDVDIIDRRRVEDSVRKVYSPKKNGWVIRCGKHPDLRDKPERRLPWHVCSSFDEMTKVVIDFYNEIGNNYYVFVHPQREMNKSGNLIIYGDRCVIEAVQGWPEGLSHGKENPLAVYTFCSPSLFVAPLKIEGKHFLTSQELYNLGHQIERRLDYRELSLTEIVVIEFSISNQGEISAHDIHVN